MNFDWKNLVVVVVIVGGGVAIWRTASMVMGDPQARALSQEEIGNTLQNALREDRLKYEQMKKKHANTSPSR